MLTGACGIPRKKGFFNLRWAVAKSSQGCLDSAKKCQSPCCVIVIQLAAIALLRPTSGKCTVVTGFLNWPGILQIPEPFPASVEKRVKSRQSWKNAAAEPSLTPIPAARTDAPNQHEWRRLIIRGIKRMGIISPCGCTNLKVLHRLVAHCSEITCTRAGARIFAYGIRPHLCLMDGTYLLPSNRPCASPVLIP